MNNQYVPLKIDESAETLRGDTDFLDRLNAYAGGDDVPLIWTPEHVQVRLSEAFEVLHRLPVNTRPQTRFGYWPDVVLNDLERRDLDRVAMREDAQRRARAAPSSHEISRMDEALAWPMQHLGNVPIQADALTLFCQLHAADREILPVLRTRQKRAQDFAKRQSAILNALESQRGAREERARIGSAITAWANTMLACHPAHSPMAEAIKTEARLKMREACQAAGVMPLAVKPHEAVPNICLSRSTLDRMRKKGAATIANALAQAMVAVR